MNRDVLWHSVTADCYIYLIIYCLTINTKIFSFATVECVENVGVFPLYFSYLLFGYDLLLCDLAWKRSKELYGLHHRQNKLLSYVSRS